jgi:hypothetical protein
MSHRTATGDRGTAHGDHERFDHSAHPITRSTLDDLRAPGGGTTERPDGRKDLRGGVFQQDPVAPPDSASLAVSCRRNSRVRRLDSRGSAHK